MCILISCLRYEYPRTQRELLAEPGLTFEKAFELSVDLSATNGAWYIYSADNLPTCMTERAAHNYSIPTANSYLHC